MNYLQREDLAQKIGFFLVSQGLKVWDNWEGRLTKKEQLDAFGFYLGKGTIIVSGEFDNISMRIKVAFGQDYDDVRGISARYQEHTAAWDNAGKSQFRDYCKFNDIQVA